MPHRRIKQATAAILLVAAGIALFGWSSRQTSTPVPGPIGLFSSLPLIWGEGEDPRQLLAAGQPPHRVRLELAAVGPIRAYDTLDNLDPDLPRLVIAQPRPLSPTENVALDNWLRAGGQLLLLADPMLTEPSAYALGDPRRPQDMVLLSPILARWGLELTFDDQQANGVRSVMLAGGSIPVNLAGAWRTTAAACRTEGEGVLVTCQIGRGRVVALADAEILSAQDLDHSRAAALTDLLGRAFGKH